MIDLTKTIGAVAASVAALGGSYTLADKFGFLTEPSLSGLQRILKLWQRLESPSTSPLQESKSGMTAQ